ncbi:MAG: hypothetical protein Kapaf2KO_16280 [Candidatus Kapaibacteriales bacterium]
MTNRYSLCIILYLFASSLIAQVETELDAHLVGRWEFECGLNANEGIRLSYDSTGIADCVKDGVLFSANRFLEENIEIVSTPEESALPTSGFTYATWVKWYRIPTVPQQRIFSPIISFNSQQNGEDIYFGLGSDFTNSDELAFLVDGQGGAGQTAFQNDGIARYKPQGGFEDSTWYHVAAVKDYESNKSIIYLNGQPVAEKSYEIANPLNKEFPGNIAAHSLTETTALFLNGELDDFRIYDKPLSPNEILEVFNAKPQPFRVQKSDSIANLCSTRGELEVLLVNRFDGTNSIAEIDLKSGQYFSFTDPSPVTLSDFVDTLKLELSFNGNIENQGDYRDTLIVTPADDKYETLRVPIVATLLSFRSDTIDFGEIVYCSDTTVYSASRRIEQFLGFDEYELDRIEFIGDNITLNLVQGDTLNSQAVQDIIARITTKASETIDQSARLYLKNCENFKELYFKGNIVEKNIRFSQSNKLWFPNNLETVFKTVQVYNKYFEDKGTFNYSWSTNSGVVEVEENGIYFQTQDTINIDVVAYKSNGTIYDTLLLDVGTICGDTTLAIPFQIISDAFADIDMSIQSLDTLGLRDIAEVIINIDSTALVEESGIESIEFDLVWNGSMLTAENDIDLKSESGFYVSSNISIPATELLEGNKIPLVNLTSVIGSSRTDSIFINNISATGGLFDISASGIEVNQNFENENIPDDLRIATLPQPQVTIYPNPIDGGGNLNVNIEFEGKDYQIKSISLIDLSGEITEANNTYSDISNNVTASFAIAKPKGTYIVKIEYEDKSGNKHTSSKKLQIKK